MKLLIEKTRSLVREVLGSWTSLIENQNQKVTYDDWDWNHTYDDNENIYKRELLLETRKKISKFDFPTLLPLSVSVAHQTIGNDLVAVAPMDLPTGQLFYFDHNYEHENMYKRKVLLEKCKKRTIFRSPGVYTREVDISVVNATPAPTCSWTINVQPRTPIEELNIPITITSTDDFDDAFGKL